MPSHSLTNFEIQKYYQSEPKFYSVYSRKNLPKIKDGACVINLEEYKSIGTYWIALYVNDNNVTNFDSFWVENILKAIKKFLENISTITCYKNIHRIQAYDSTMCRYFCIGFIDFMLKGKSLLDYTNLFFANGFKNDDK